MRLVFMLSICNQSRTKMKKKEQFFQSASTNPSPFQIIFFEFDADIFHNKDTYPCLGTSVKPFSLRQLK